MKLFIAKNWLLVSGTLWFLLLFKLLWYKTKAWSTVQCKQETLENIEHYHQQYNDDNKAHNVTSKGTPLSRSKRFISFPLGSSFSTSICMTTGVIGNPNQSYLSMGLNWGIAYDLPNITWVLGHAHGFKAATRQQDKNMIDAQIKRRHRRALYNKLEIAISSMGYNGHDCVLRALCESRQYFRQEKMSMIGEMLRTIFSLPKQRLLTRELDEHSDIALYDHAYREAHSVTRCEEQYHQCGFSLLELAFGRYSKPPKGY